MCFPYWCDSGRLLCMMLSLLLMIRSTSTAAMRDSHEPWGVQCSDDYSAYCFGHGTCYFVSALNPPTGCRYCLCSPGFSGARCNLKELHGLFSDGEQITLPSHRYIDGRSSRKKRRSRRRRSVDRCLPW